MWLFSRLRGRCYCAFCKAPRRIYVKKHADLTNVAWATAFALTTTYALWASLDPRGLLLVGAFIMAAEIFVYVRWRLALVCGLCGFDPIVYKKSPERAATRVRDFFHTQVENPEFWLTKSPLLKVQKRIRENEKKALELQIISARTKGSLASNKTV